MWRVEGREGRREEARTSTWEVRMASAGPRPFTHCKQFVAATRIRTRDLAAGASLSAHSLATTLATDHAVSVVCHRDFNDGRVPGAEFSRKKVVAATRIGTRDQAAGASLSAHSLATTLATNHAVNVVCHRDFNEGRVPQAEFEYVRRHHVGFAMMHGCHPKPTASTAPLIEDSKSSRLTPRSPSTGCPSYESAVTCHM